MAGDSAAQKELLRAEMLGSMTVARWACCSADWKASVRVEQKGRSSVGRWAGQMVDLWVAT